MRNVDCAEIISQTDSLNLLYYSRLSGLETTTSSLNSLCFRSVEPIEPVEPIALLFQDIRLSPERPGFLKLKSGPPPQY